jgi:hypothetical protein
LLFSDMLQQWHTIVDQLHSEDGGGIAGGTDSMYTGTNYSITGTATPINMMNSGTLMSNDGNSAGGYGTLRSTGGQMFDALSDKVNIRDENLILSTNLEM